MEELATRHTYWLQTAANHKVPHSLETAAVDVTNFEHRCEAPDVLEGDGGELTSPVHRDANTTEYSRELVAATLPEVEAAEGELPDTVDTMNVIWFC